MGEREGNIRKLVAQTVSPQNSPFPARQDDQDWCRLHRPLSTGIDRIWNPQDIVTIVGASGLIFHAAALAAQRGKMNVRSQAPHAYECSKGIPRGTGSGRVQFRCSSPRGSGEGGNMEAQ